MRPTDSVFRSIVLLVIALLLGAGWLAAQTAEEEEDPIKALGMKLGRDRAVRDTELEAIAAKAPTGLLGVKWLMSKEDVKKLRPEVKDFGADGLWEHAEVFGQVGLVIYTFQKDAFLLVTVSFAGEATERNFANTRKQLEKDYGPMPVPKATEHAVSEAAKQVDRYAVVHRVLLTMGTEKEQIQLYRGRANE